MRTVLQILLILLISISLVNAQDYVKLKYFYYPKTFVVEQGKSNSSFVMLENTYNETLYNIFLKFQLPAGIEATQEQEGIEELWQNQKDTIQFNLTAITIANGTYNVTIWAESINQIGSNYIQSPKQTFILIVLKNITEIKTTTSSSVTTIQPTGNTTTTVSGQTTETLESNNTSSEQGERKFSPIIAGLGLLLILIMLFVFMRR
ncbi:MAG: hypothetical protein ACK4MM_05885 [Fervidobacterium sp.]